VKISCVKGFYPLLYLGNGKCWKVFFFVKLYYVFYYFVFLHVTRRDLASSIMEGKSICGLLKTS
jgi:hypothetical protein